MFSNKLFIISAIRDDIKEIQLNENYDNINEKRYLASQDNWPPLVNQYQHNNWTDYVDRTNVFQIGKAKYNFGYGHIYSANGGINYILPYPGTFYNQSAYIYFTQGLQTKQDNATFTLLHSPSNNVMLVLVEKKDKSFQLFTFDIPIDAWLIKNTYVYNGGLIDPQSFVDQAITKNSAIKELRDKNKILTPDQVYNLKITSVKYAGKDDFLLNFRKIFSSDLGKQFYVNYERYLREEITQKDLLLETEKYYNTIEKENSVFLDEYFMISTIMGHYKT